MSDMVEEALKQGGLEGDEPVYEDLKAESAYGSGPTGLGEAGGVAWTDVYVGGFKISLTERRANGMAALDDLITAVQYAQDRYGATGFMTATFNKKEGKKSAVTKKADNAPSTAPISDVALSAVTTIKYIKSKKNNRMWLIVTTPDHEDGCLADPQLAPPDVNLDAWTLYEEYAPPASMSFVVVNDKNFVERFQSEV